MISGINAKSIRQQIIHTRHTHLLSWFNGHLHNLVSTFLKVQTTLTQPTSDKFHISILHVPPSLYPPLPLPLYTTNHWYLPWHYREVYCPPECQQVSLGLIYNSQLSSLLPRPLPRPFITVPLLLPVWLLFRWGWAQKVLLYWSILLFVFNVVWVRLEYVWERVRQRECNTQTVLMIITCLCYI